jgi:hypothetical protein
MGAITKGRFPGLLAKAPSHRFFFLNHHFHRCATGALMTSITEWLVRRLTTGTPPIGAGFHFGDVWLRGTDFCGLHAHTLAHCRQLLKPHSAAQKLPRIHKTRSLSCIGKRNAFLGLQVRAVEYVSAPGQVTEIAEGHPSKQDSARGRKEKAEVHEMEKKRWVCVTWSDT